MGDETKKFKVKVYFDDATGLCEGIAVKDAYGNTAGMAIVIGDERCNLPRTSKTSLKICDAEIVVKVPKEKQKGEITIHKKNRK